MKRRELLKILRKNNCVFLREGSRHSIFINLNNNRKTSIPRHNEIDEFLVKEIFKHLEI